MAVCYSNHRKRVQTLRTLLGNAQVPVLFFSLQIYWSSSYIPHSGLFIYAFVILSPFSFLTNTFHALQDSSPPHHCSVTALSGSAELQDLNSLLWLVPGTLPGRDLLRAQLQRGTIHITACVNVLYDLPGGLSLSLSLSFSLSLSHTHTHTLLYSTCLSFGLHISLGFLGHSGQRCSFFVFSLSVFFLKLWSSSFFIQLRPSCYSWSWLCLSVLSALERHS